MKKKQLKQLSGDLRNHMRSRLLLEELIEQPFENEYNNLQKTVGVIWYRAPAYCFDT